MSLFEGGSGTFEEVGGGMTKARIWKKVRKDTKEFRSLET
jgi:hypothetical protein